MKNWAVLIFTAVIVSVDSFVVGFGVSLNKKGNLCLPSAVALATLTLCLVTTALGKFLHHYLHVYVDVLGATLLFTLGVANLFKNEDAFVLGQLSLKECFAVGFTVGLDGAVANLSLVMDGFGLIAPLAITLTHFLTVLVGQAFASKVKIADTGKLSAVTLMTLAVTKLI